jgi:hypothetical protein
MTTETSTSSPTHNLPLTSSDERMHVLDETCWCGPVVETFGPNDEGPRASIVHRGSERCA